MNIEFIAHIHLFSTLFMTGLIWLVQMVHYPSFKFVDEKLYTDFQLFHMNKITVVVLPMMLMELFSLLLLSYLNLTTPFIICLILLGLIWMNTFFWNVPLHQKLVKQKDNETINRLVISNWPRTILWSVKSIYLVFFT